MKTPTHFLTALGLTCCALLVLAANTQAKSSEQTIKNLNAAYQGESNASNRYAKFAEKADAEGYSQVAKLFRAASTAEAIHRDTHKAAILELGGVVETFQLDPVKPGTTEENLKAAIKGESYERDTMYPGLLPSRRRITLAAPSGPSSSPWPRKRSTRSSTSRLSTPLGRTRRRITMSARYAG